MKKFLISAALLAAALSEPALARPPATAPGEPVSADRILAVRTADLDLTSPAGISALDRRIRAAIRVACGTASDADLRGKNQVRQCRADALESVEAQRQSAIARARSISPVLASQ